MPRLSATDTAATPCYPFLFFGQGLAKGGKCLEGYLWFARPPESSVQEQITHLVPVPVRGGVRFEGPIMHFGSDDRLPAYVKATYNPQYVGRPLDESLEQLDALWRAESPDYEPTTEDWAEFCEEFQRAVLLIHELSALRAVIKGNDRQHVIEFGPWHDWSLARVPNLVGDGLALELTRSVAYLAANLIQDALTLAAVATMTGPTRTLWLRWLDRLVAEAPQELRSQFARAAYRLVRSFEPEQQAELTAALRPATQAALHKEADLAQRLEDAARVNEVLTQAFDCVLDDDRQAIVSTLATLDSVSKRDLMGFARRLGKKRPLLALRILRWLFCQKEEPGGGHSMVRAYQEACKFALLHGDPDDRRDIVDRALRCAGQDALTHLVAARVLCELREADQALQAIRTAVRRNPALTRRISEDQHLALIRDTDAFRALVQEGLETGK